MEIFEKNKVFIQSQQFPQSFDVGIYVKDYIQDPEFVRFYLTSNYPTKTYIIYKITSDNLEYQKEKVITGLTRIDENLSSIFNVSPSELDGKVLDIIIKTDKGAQGMDSISLSTSTKILNISSNTPSYLQTNVLSNLYPGNNVLYLPINPDKAIWMDLYQIKEINLNKTKKLESLNLKEDFNLSNFEFTFLDSESSNPIVGANLYLNNFFVGYTDGNGKYYFKYHKNFNALVELKDKCHFFSKKVNVSSNKTFYVNNLCSNTETTGSGGSEGSSGGESGGGGESTTHSWSLVIHNPNTYALQDYQLEIDVSDVKSTTQTFSILTSSSEEINYTLEKSNGEMTNDVSLWDTNKIWIKIPYIPANGNVQYVIYQTTSSYATNPENVFDLYEDFEDGLNGWSFSGNKGWQQSSTAYKGNYGGQNEDINNNQKACMYKTISLSQKATITFYYKVSSEKNYDFLKYYLDGSAQLAESGNVDWREYSGTINSGNHEIKFCYEKDYSVSVGTDSGYLDDIIVKKYADNEPTYTITQIS